MSGSDSSDPYQTTFPSTLKGPDVTNGNISFGQVKANYEKSAVFIAKDLILEDPDSGESLNIAESIRAMQERLLILQPNFEQMKHYPALRDAYEQYKMLEKLLIDEAKNENSVK